MPKRRDDPISGRHLDPREETSDIADELTPDSPSAALEAALIGQVEEAIRSRGLRYSYLPAHLLGEPVWDMLLELLGAELIEETVTMARLATAAGVPVSTAIRWVEVLIQGGVCSSVTEKATGHQVRLTARGGALLRDYFARARTGDRRTG